MDKLGTDVQLTACRKRAKDERWVVVREFVDRNRSAWDPKTRREAFEEMLTQVRDGQIDVIVCWKFDRLVRRTRDFERVADALEAGNARLITLRDNIDTGSQVGELAARFMLILAQAESANTSERIRSHNTLKAQKGIPFTSGARGFGHTQDRRQVIDKEAEVVREAVDRLLAGESLRRLTFDFAARKITGTRGATFTMKTLKTMLISPRLIGERVHKDEAHPSKVIPPILVQADGKPDVERWQRLVDLLTNERRRTYLTKDTHRAYLLSGLITCAECGQPMVARPRGDKVRRYVCPKLPNRHDCPTRTATLAEPVEILVREATLRLLDSEEFRRAVAEQAPSQPRRAAIQGELAALDRRREEAATEFRHGKITVRMVRTIDQQIQRESDRLEAELAKLTQRAFKNVPIGVEDLRARWEAGDHQWRRGLLRNVIREVRISKAVKGRNTFDQSRVEIVWREI